MGACDRVCVEYECVDQDGSGDLEWWLVVIEDCVLGVAEGDEGVGGSGRIVEVLALCVDTLLTR